MELAHDTELTQLDSFDAAFPIEPGHEADALRLFGTLFVDAADSGANGHTPIRKARNYKGGVYALKTGRKDDPVFYEEYRTHCSIACLRGFPDVFGYGTCKDDAIIVMEWVEGTTLRGAADPFPVSSIASLGLAMCKLLEQANEAKAGFVHRDISPRNIMLRTEKMPAAEQVLSGEFDLCLLDFGSATPVTDDPSFTKLSGIYRFGTPDYAPPEMLTEDVDLQEADRASETIDVYALCSVLYELYSGTTPYRLTAQVGASPYRVKTEHDLPKLAVKTGDGGALARIIEAGLALRQQDRPSVHELSCALENWLDDPRAADPGLPQSAQRTHKSMWQPDYQGRLISRRRFVAAGIIAGAAAISAAIVGTTALQRKAGAELDAGQFPAASSLYEGEPLYKVYDAQHPGWAFATEQGSIACRPQTSREIGALREGAASCYSDAAKGYGFIVPGQGGAYAWSVLPSFSQLGDYSEGLAAAKDPASGLWGYLDPHGEWVIPPSFSQAHAFSNGVAAVCPDGGELWGGIDPNGSWVLQPAFAALGARSAEGYAVAQAAPLSWAGSPAWGIVNADGSWACDARFYALRRFSNGMAPCRKAEDGQWGFADEHGNWVIEPQFMDARAFSSKVAAVQDAKTQLWYFIDAHGEPYGKSEPKFWKLGSIVDGLAPAQASAADRIVELDSGERASGAQMRYGYVDADGEWHMKRLVTLVNTAIEVPMI